jgi:hypothetical protein
MSVRGCGDFICIRTTVVVMHNDAFAAKQCLLL